jgi:hypothetical protein
MALDPTFPDNPYDAGEGDSMSLPPTIITGYPGNDTTPVPTSDPWGTINGVFGKVASAVQGGVDAYIGFKQGQANTAYRIEQQKLTADIQMARLKGAAAYDTYRIAAENNIARNQFARMPGLTQLFGGNTPPGSSDFFMLILTVAGLFVAYKSVNKA